MRHFFLFVFFFANALFAQDGGKPVTFLLPINWSGATKVDLVVPIPKGYQAIQPFESWEASPIIEFIPEGEGETGWSEIITIIKYLGLNLKAENVASRLKKALLAKAENGKVLFEETDSEESVEKAAFGLSYDYQGKHEILGASYFSGPYDCVGVQYTIRLKKDESEKQAQEKIGNFLKTVTIKSE